MAPLRLLMIGPLPPPIGGDTKGFAVLTRQLAGTDGVVLTGVVNTSRGLYPNSLWRNVMTAARVVFHVLSRGWGSDVIVFNSSSRAMALFGPLIFVLSRALGKPLVCRLYGGSYPEYMREAPSWIQWLVKRTVHRSAACLFETRHQIKLFRRWGGRTLEWFPSYTDAAPPGPPSSTCRRFVFISQVRAEKGVETILEATSFLPQGLEVDIYGPLYGPYTTEYISTRSSGRARYLGEIPNSKVHGVLAQYDALLLPSYHHGEGYPNIIVEAFMMGRPVIASRWLSIPELVLDDCGLLVPTKDAQALARAMSALAGDDPLYRRLCVGARKRALEFTDERWHPRFVEICRDAAKR